MLENIPNCLTIAGSDCSGGAGIQADLKTFSALGCFGVSAVTSIVAENTTKVISIQNTDVKIVADQLDAVFSDVEVSAVKLGMLPTVEIIKAVAQKLEQYKPAFVVCDPVMVATSGDALTKNTGDALKEYIFPLSDIATPNIPEAAELSGIAVGGIADFDKAAQEIMKCGVKSLLIKGGHSQGDAVDVLYTADGKFPISSKRIDTQNTHGTGCTLSSAICSYLAQGEDMVSAVTKAKEYITNAISYANKLNVGKGHGPTNHFYEFYKMKGIL